MLHGFAKPAGDVFGTLQFEGGDVGGGERSAPSSSVASDKRSRTPFLPDGSFASRRVLRIVRRHFPGHCDLTPQPFLRSRRKCFFAGQPPPEGPVGFPRDSRAAPGCRPVPRPAPPASQSPANGPRKRPSARRHPLAFRLAWQSWIAFPRAVVDGTRWCAGNKCPGLPRHRWRCLARSGRTAGLPCRCASSLRVWRRDLRSVSLPRTMWLAMASRSSRAICISASTRPRSGTGPSRVGSRKRLMEIITYRSFGQRTLGPPLLLEDISAGRRVFMRIPPPPSHPFPPAIR